MGLRGARQRTVAAVALGAACAAQATDGVHADTATLPRARGALPDNTLLAPWPGISTSTHSANVPE
jgi:hypothetical protein